MEDYEIVGKIGNGSYGDCFKAMSLSSKEMKAIKRLKKTVGKWEDCLKLREIQCLKILHHPNLISLHQVIKHQNQIYLVFELLEINLYDYIKTKTLPFAEAEIKSISYQVLLGLNFIHSNGFMHRDLKPENILLSDEIIKIADFGFCRALENTFYTPNVATRWYKAPEILLNFRDYNTPIDIWALGCIIGEMYLLRPLFPGENEIDEFFQICSLLGPPTEKTWYKGFQAATNLNLILPQKSGVSLSGILSNASLNGIQLIHELLKYDPNERPSAENVMTNF